MRSLLPSLRTAALLAVAVVVGAAPRALAQSSHSNGAGDATGRIVGRVIDAQTGAPLPGARITVAEAGASAVVSVDGHYTLLGVPAGSVSVSVRMIGYQPKMVSNLQVAAGGAAELDVALSPAAAIELETVTVTADAERGSVVRALETQRTATGIVSAITAQQISKSPDGDAGQAVQRVSGVTVQDGKYVFVRGLGERYTTTSLNGSRVPSPEPERRLVPLDLFPAGLLETITTSKTFTPDQPGDFTGAQVDIQTREFPESRVLSVSLSAGLNDAATGRDVWRAPTVGMEWLGFAGDARNLPGIAREAGDLRGVTQGEANQIAGSFRNAWTPSLEAGSPNGSLSVSLGGEDLVFGHAVGYLGTLTYSYGQEVRRDEERAVAVTGDGPSGTRPQNAYRGSSGRTSVLWGGLLNLSTRLGDGTKVSLNNTYTRSADNEATRLAGVNEEFGQTFDVARLTFTERNVRSHQLTGAHLLGTRHSLDWSATTSAVTRNEPDRSDLVYEAQLDEGEAQPLRWFGAPRTATRTFSALDESSADVGASLRLGLGPVHRPLALKLGGSFRTVERDADTRAFDLINGNLDDAERAAPAESIFDGHYAADGRLLVFINANGGRYTASDRVAAGFVQAQVPLTGRLELVGGARVERASLTVDTRTVTGAVSQATLDDTDVLPALALNYRLGDDHVFRLSASRTLSRPEYRELSEVAYFDILGGLSVFGNPDLRRALIQNYDARWEWYPHAGEVVSVAVFHKRFQDPIERILVGTTGASAVSFVNAEAATNLGVELEVRKMLPLIAPSLPPATVFANATIMESDITPGAEGVSSLTSSQRPMVGQAGYVVNAGVTVADPASRLNATLLYNVVGKRIVDAGTLPLPDAYEQPRHLLDLSLQLPLADATSVKLDAKNLLDAPHLVTQGSVTRLRYRTGRVYSLGVTWTP